MPETNQTGSVAVLVIVFVCLAVAVFAVLYFLSQPTPQTTQENNPFVDNGQLDYQNPFDNL